MDKLEDLRKKKEGVIYDTLYTSSTTTSQAELGTIEKDASGHLGKFQKEPFRGSKIFDLLAEKDFDTVLDVGAGKLEATSKFIELGKIVDICEFEGSYYLKNSNVDQSKIRFKIIGDINELEITTIYDAIWAAHILEHQLNPNLFLKKLHLLLKEGGYLAIVVPPRKPFVVGGHVSIWNGGLLLYHLVLAGFNCKNAQLLQYDYNIGVVVKKETMPEIKLNYDLGDLEILKEFFPMEIGEGFNGDIMRINV